MKRFISVFLCFVMMWCTLSSGVAPLIVSASENAYQFVLDTDGIDAGAQYIIASAESGSAMALKMDDTRPWETSSESITIKSSQGANVIDAFENDGFVTWTFSNSSYGTVSSNGYYLNILQYSRYQTEAVSLYFSDLGEGRYGIYLEGGANTNLQYLGINSENTWATMYNYGVSGDKESDYNGSFLYLFKKVPLADPTYTVKYDSNGATIGEVPSDVLELETGETHVVQSPVSELIKDENDNIYLFKCWNTAADGSGTDYVPGDTLTVKYFDVTLYAKWYMQTKYTVTVVTNLDNTPTDVKEITGEDTTVFVSDDNGVTFYELTESSEGTYTVNVSKNGTYYVYFRNSNGEYVQVHNHQVAIYNQNGYTVLQNFSVTYDTGITQDSAGTNETVTWQENFHANTTVLTTDTVPVRNGYTFKGWYDENGNLFEAGSLITQAITQPCVLTAAWEETNTITVDITVNHAALSGGFDNNDNRYDVSFQLLQVSDGVNLPVENGYIELDENHQSYTPGTNSTSYTYSFTDMPQGEYNVSTAKSGYELTVTKSEDGKTIYIVYTYTPSVFDLHFNIKVADNTPAELYPQSVNIKVTYWGYNENDELGWHVITQQQGDGAPVNVTIDKNGTGSGFYPVWKSWSTEGNNTYDYRVDVTSFVLPDGTIVPASTSDHVSYTADGTSLYTAGVTIEGDSRVPSYPDGSNTLLSGVYYDGQAQSGTPLVTINTQAFNVVFDAGEGTINTAATITLTNQYRYPNLYNYIPETAESGKIFLGWYAGSTPAENKAGQFLNEHITYIAKWSDPRSVTGTVTIAGTYIQDGQTVDIIERDRATSVMAVLQKLTNGVYNDTAHYIIEFPGNYGDTGSGTYSFSVPDDGSEYRINILALNYICKYDNNSDSVFTQEEYNIIHDDATGMAVVDAHLSFTPESYFQMSVIDASQISENYRPTAALSQILYHDLGTSEEYQVISQHTVAPYGTEIAINENGEGREGYNVWKWHTDGTRYEYKMAVSTLYGNVEGAYTQTGIPYNSVTSPYTIRYRFTSWWDSEAAGASGTIKAILTPKEYEVFFDMGLEDGESVLGMENYVTDSGMGEHYYSYNHVWSFDDRIMAFPYREGYVFKGWECDHEGIFVNNDGYITIAAGLSENVTLTAKWEKLDGICYTVRYLELNTNTVLHGAKVVQDVAQGTAISPHYEHIIISGYKYEGVAINGKYYDNSQAPDLTVSSNNAENIIILYYIPDGSDGYTDQVESNLHLDKTATLEDNGTYTITMETYTRDNPITTQIMQNTPLDIVLVLDQSGSIINSGYLDDLEAAVENFISLIADHGRENEVDHRIAMVGYAGDNDEPPTSDDTDDYPIAGGNTSEWVNTGVFDSNGDFHPYPVTGFNYTQYTGNPTATGTYYVKNDDEYLLLMYHDTYYHLISEDDAKIEILDDNTVYGYVQGAFVPLTRNLSGLWLYGDNQLYSAKEFFTYHEDVWTHRSGMDERQIHAYGTGSSYICTDGHSGLYTRTETRDEGPELNVYKDALIPVSVGDNGSGSINPGLIKSANGLGSNGGTFVQYGIEMANKVFAANPLDEEEGRVRIMIMFTDGMPGIGTFNETVANAAIARAYTTKNTHNAYSYTIGLYPDSGVTSTSDVSIYMNAVSSNYQTAQQMSDVYTPGTYYNLSQGTSINDGKTYYVKVTTGYWLNQTTNYYPLRYGTFTASNGSTYTGWYYVSGTTYTLVTTTRDATVGSNSKIGSYTINGNTGGYKEATSSGYYSTTESEEDLIDYFSYVMKEITTKVTTKIILHEDTILRDVMGQGLELTNGTVITAYRQAGTYNAITDSIDWNVNEDGTPALEYVAQLDMSENKLESDEKAVLDNTTDGVSKTVSYIQVYNYDAQNTTDPDGTDYSPHTVDITGYDFENWYISDTNPKGYKMLVEITRVEARDNVVRGRSTPTNNEISGLWLPADANGERELLLPFNQPTTIFVERAYVVDYAKPFELSGWFFDKTEGNEAVGSVHIDTDISDGMNWFDETNPDTSSYTNARFGNISVTDGVVTYTPTAMNWNEPEQFYIFGDTENQTVLTQDANTNGNLWTKVTIIPANSVYYEDSFVSSEDTDINGYDGFEYTGNWVCDYSGNQSDADKNTETPEHLENSPYGDVHGWIDSVGDDDKYSDASAHTTGLDSSYGASVEFTFTGTGVDVYTRTNSTTGLAVAMIKKIVESTDANGNTVTEETTVSGVKNQIIDNLSLSGDYYHIPTVSFKELPYGTYKIKILASSASDAATGEKRTAYYLDGVRIYNPLNTDQTDASDQVRDAYGKELNAVFTEIRDVLLDYQDFNPDMTDTTDGKEGAVFIDWIREGQESGDDSAATGTPSYELGTFENYGPKNEVYLSPGQAIVLKVNSDNTYYVGMKSIDGRLVKANVSGITKAEPVTVNLTHSTDMYYQVTPIDGYIVIENASEGDEVLSLTKLRTTNLYAPVYDGGVQPVTAVEAVAFMTSFSLRMNPPAPEVPEDDITTPEDDEEENTESSPVTPEDNEEPSDNQSSQTSAIENFFNRLIDFIKKLIDTVINIFSKLSEA